MYWEALVLGILLLLGFGVAILMARRHKTATIIREEVDIDALVERVAKEVGKTIAEELAKRLIVGHPVAGQVANQYGKVREENTIKMDESVIPISVNVEVESENLDNMLTEEEKEDKGLQESKNKLAELMKKRINNGSGT